MAIYDKLQTALADRDIETYIGLLHDDAVFVFHKSGSQFTKKEWSILAADAMESDGFVQESSRCVFENDLVLVTHAFMRYPDKTKEAVLAVLLKKDEKIIRMETGSTPL